ncbi:putative late blight resistance protein homolog R1A-10 [Ipomoea triloba]|uniref:putative late blight resistance protein homolog R1A-10 n=1 Tax=Ipomoea triloba TaxID=35885 RepID=UPI00125D60F1|nr:putative late blight resistance protein homolog R1A-10 [Ipomoea triloba]
MVIAGILSKAEMKVEDWENVAKDVALSSTLYEEQNCEKILLLSYNHLPENLKTCFLYLGVFPEDYEISARTLVGHRAAWNFVKDEALIANKKEEVAWQKLQDLIDRNLISVEKRGWSGRIKTCKIHDLTREMCLRLAKGKNILHAIDDKFQVGQSSKEISQENGNFWDAKHPIDLVHTLSHFKQLENIKFYGTKSLKKIALVPKPYDFPPKLKKLKFSVTMMKLEIMTILGRLPNLQVLQLEKDAFDDSETEWEQVEEGFPKLEVLVFKDQTLCRWIDCSFSFPRLECLVLKSCRSLESLPYDCLSGCPCLKLIELERCDYSVLESAKKIQNDGDGLLEVRYFERLFARQTSRNPSF